MKSVADLESTLVGVAGEYYVAAELTMRGHIASITLRNSRGVDIIASNNDASASVSIQVKTINNSKPKWLLNSKSENFFSENHFYVLVALRKLGERPDFYVVPSKDIAHCVKTSHEDWLAGKKSDGTSRKDSAMRNFADIDGQYKEAWQLLGL